MKKNMRLIIITGLLLLSFGCQKTEVSVTQPANNNGANRVSTENVKVENTKTEANITSNSEAANLSNSKANTSSNSNENKSLANKTIASSTPADGLEKRCGWLANPTPANFWLNDKDGEWTIGVQGGYQADGMDNLPDFGSQWVKTNGNYGYGCICMDVKVDKKEQKVTTIKSASVRPLSVCRNDKSLKES